MHINSIYIPSVTGTTTTFYPTGDYWYNRRYCNCCGWYHGYNCPCWIKVDNWKQQELEQQVKKLQEEVKKLKKVPRDNTQVFLQKRRGK